MSFLELDPDKLMHTKVVRQAGVGAATFKEATARGAVARAKLAAHRSSGDARIEVKRGLVVDAFVYLADERGANAAAAIEYGRRSYTREILDKHGNVRTVTIAGSKPVGALKAALAHGR